jgi:hypothetical protein
MIYFFFAPASPSSWFGTVHIEVGYWAPLVPDFPTAAAFTASRSAFFLPVCVSFHRRGRLTRFWIFFSFRRLDAKLLHAKEQKQSPKVSAGIYWTGRTHIAGELYLYDNFRETAGLFKSVGGFRLASLWKGTGDFFSLVCGEWLSQLGPIGT